MRLRYIRSALLVSSMSFCLPGGAAAQEGGMSLAELARHGRERKRSAASPAYTEDVLALNGNFVLLDHEPDLFLGNTEKSAIQGP